MTWVQNLIIKKMFIICLFINLYILLNILKDLFYFIFEIKLFNREFLNKKYQIHFKIIINF